MTEVTSTHMGTLLLAGLSPFLGNTSSKREADGFSDAVSWGKAGAGRRVCSALASDGLAESVRPSSAARIS